MLGLGDAGQRKCSLACKNQVKEGAGAWARGWWVCVHQGDLWAQLFTVPGRVGAASPANKAPRMLKHCKHGASETNPGPCGAQQPAY